MVNVTVVQLAKEASICLEIGTESTISVLKMLIEVDLNIKPENQLLYFNDEPLRGEDRTLEQVGISEGAILALVDNSANALDVQPPSSVSTRRQSRTQDLLYGQRMPGSREEAAKMSQALMNPFSIESQQYLEERIDLERVSENISLANEYLPESFATVFMLFVKIEVNNTPVQAFVDSGAQATIMSKKCAERCNLSKLIDKRYQGTAKGVGTSNIIGKIHLADIRIGNVFYPASFTILDDNTLEFLLGLDLLKRYQCNIDLRKNVLRIGDNEVPFLDEKDISNPIHGATQ